MKKIRIIIISISILILVGVLVVILLNQNLTGRVVEMQEEDIYTYTKAICDETNYCQDYEVKCNGEELLDMQPIGEAQQYSENWQDPRDEEVIERLCG